MPAFTARNVAKFVAKALVAAKTAELTEDLMVDHTQYDEDATIVDITGKIAGWYVSEKLEPVTDRIVDQAADQIVALKRKLKHKKSDEETV